MKDQIYKVAIYIRLSREDGDNLESESIRNQRDLLQLYIKKSNNNLCYVDEYVDDGFSGSTFDRPSWKRLILDIENKRINTIITKDLSRMGRDYISMGQYIERIFPEKNIRYIAVNDNIDTLYETPGLEFLQFKLIFNDFYLKDTSKKIRKVLRAKKEQGQFLGWKAVYGYKKKLSDKHKLVVDENVRSIVERMFHLAESGKSPRQIANIFSLEKIPNPSSYANLNKSSNATSFYLWCPRTIEDMLCNQTYIGNLTQGRRKKINYKSKKEKRTPKEEWIIINNTHEPIIDKKTFETVQEMLKKGKNKPNSSNIKLFSGFMFCKECGHAIGINKSSDKKRYYCCCSYYLSHSKFNLCTPHSNNYVKLENAVLDNIRKICEKYIDKSTIENEIKKAIKKDNNKHSFDSKINILENKIKRNLNYIDKIYEDKLNGYIDIETFKRLSLKYKDEILTMNKEKTEIAKKLLKSKNIIHKKDTISFLNIIDEYLAFKNSSRSLLVNLIDKIVISENKTIEIYYKFKVL